MTNHIHIDFNPYASSRKMRAGQLSPNSKGFKGSAENSGGGFRYPPLTEKTFISWILIQLVSINSINPQALPVY